MCGIFGYIGTRTDASHIVIEGLKRLEYRGYDSWGIAVQPEHQGTPLMILKEVGKIGAFHESVPLQTGRIAIGHSRWATHGGVTVENAHPQTSEDQTIAVVHNGIIENYQVLRDELKSRGHTFRSETDTEVIPHLIEEYLSEGFERACELAFERLHGRFAVVAMKQNDATIVAARRGSPLIVGVGHNEIFIASDIPAFLTYTRRVIYLDDEEMVIVAHGMPTFKRLRTGDLLKKREVLIEWDIESAEKGEYPHFMIKEIMEQKETIRRTINQNEENIVRLAEVVRSAFGTYLVGCGTAGKVCYAASYMFSQIANHHVNVTIGSEFPNFHHFLTPRTLLIAVSQSGETADTLEAIEVAKKKGVKILSIVNVESSTMARISDYVIPLKVGPEKAVASTKATTAQMAVLMLLAYALDGRLNEGKILLVETASKINDMLNPRYEIHIESIAKSIAKHEHLYVIGRGANYPMALEAAIKLQEVSYIHAEGFAGGELKHGPIALIEQGTPTLVLVANDEVRQDTLSNAIEIKARGGYIIGVSPEPNEIFDEWIKVPDVSSASPIVNIIPIQLLAYKLAVLRKNNPDMPRNLAKSVTVK